MAEYRPYPGIVLTANVLHGKPRIEGTRMMVSTVLDLLAAGKTAAEICSDDYFPDLTVEQVQACIGYASAVIRDDQVVLTE